jgi:hypothetical protein
MKLDRNINPDGQRKYALVNLRKMREFQTKCLDPQLCDQIQESLALLQEYGIVTWGTKIPD